jgi:hypothetical protein
MLHAIQLAEYAAFYQVMEHEVLGAMLSKCSTQ